MLFSLLDTQIVSAGSLAVAHALPIASPASPRARTGPLPWATATAGPASTPLGTDPLDAWVDRWADLVAERLAAALSEVLSEPVVGRRSRHARRRMLGPANVLTVPDAIAELGMGKEEGRDWLEAKGLVHHPGRPRRGSGRVIVGELLEALKTARGGRRSRRLAPTKLPLPKTKRF